MLWRVSIVMCMWLAFYLFFWVAVTCLFMLPYRLLPNLPCIVLLVQWAVRNGAQKLPHSLSPWLAVTSGNTALRLKMHLFLLFNWISSSCIPTYRVLSPVIFVPSMIKTWRQSQTTSLSVFFLIFSTDLLASFDGGRPQLHVIASITAELHCSAVLCTVSSHFGSHKALVHVFGQLVSHKAPYGLWEHSVCKEHKHCDILYRNQRLAFS